MKKIKEYLFEGPYLLGKGRVGDFLAGAVLLAFSYMCISHETGPKITSKDQDLLMKTARQVSTYNGNNPQEVLTYAQQTLDTITKNNPNIQIPEISELEKDIVKLSEIVKTSQNPEQYDANLDEIARDLKIMEEKYGRNGIIFMGYLVAGAAGFAVLSSSLMPERWKDDFS